MIATVRRPTDGGRWSGPEEGRRMLLRQAVVGGFDWVDLETDVADAIPRYGKVRRIVSYHNMRETPADLEKIHERMCQQDADVVKLAVRHPAADRQPPRPGPDGQAGQADRGHRHGRYGLLHAHLGAKYGAPFTYAAFNKERGIAPACRRSRSCSTSITLTKSTRTPRSTA